MKISPELSRLNSLANPSPLVADKNPGVASAAAPVRTVEVAPARPASTSADFDVGRVAEIRANISAGSYHVNTEKIADGLLSTVRDLLNTKKP